MSGSDRSIFKAIADHLLVALGYEQMLIGREAELCLLLLMIGVSSTEFSKFNLKVAPCSLDIFIEDFQTILI